MGIFEEIHALLSNINEKLDNMTVVETHEHKIYEADEAAKRLGISKDKLYKMTREGEIGYLPVGSRKVFPERVIQNYIEKNIKKASEFESDIGII